MNPGLHGFLQSLRGQGVLDSTGEFGLDAEKAAERYRRFVQQEPGYPFLKLVQAAVAGRAAEVSVVFTGRNVSLHFVPTAHRDLFMGRQAEAGQRIRRYLSDALASLLSLRPTQLWWSFRSGEEATAWRWQAGRREEADLGAAREGLSVRLALPPQGWLQSLLSPRRELRGVLASRCALCPIPVFVNGISQTQPRPEYLLLPEIRETPLVVCELVSFSLDHRESFPVLPPPHRGCEELILHDGTRLGVRGGTSVVTTLWRDGPDRFAIFHCDLVEEGEPSEGRLPGPGDLILQYRYSEFPGSRADRFFLSRLTALGELGPHILGGLQVGEGSLAGQLSGLQTTRWQQRFDTPVLAGRYQLMLLSRPLATGQVHFVCDGIALRSTPWPSAVPGLLAVVADNDLETDASGLEVVRNDRLQAKLAALDLPAQELLEAARPHFKDLGTAHLNGLSDAQHRRLARAYG